MNERAIYASEDPDAKSGESHDFKALEHMLLEEKRRLFKYGAGLDKADVIAIVKKWLGVTK